MLFEIKIGYLDIANLLNWNSIVIRILRRVQVLMINFVIDNCKYKQRQL